MFVVKICDVYIVIEEKLLFICFVFIINIYINIILGFNILLLNELKCNFYGLIFVII